MTDYLELVGGLEKNGLDDHQTRILRKYGWKTVSVIRAYYPWIHPDSINMRYTGRAAWKELLSRNPLLEIEELIETVQKE